jgi:hypothetical protein
MTSAQKLSRLSFGRVATTERIKIEPCVKDNIGALVMTYGDGLRNITEDLTLVFPNIYEINILMEKLEELKDLMNEAERQKNGEPECN